MRRLGVWAGQERPESRHADGAAILPRRIRADEFAASAARRLAWTSASLPPWAMAGQPCRASGWADRIGSSLASTRTSAQIWPERACHSHVSPPKKPCGLGVSWLAAAGLVPARAAVPGAPQQIRRGPVVIDTAEQRAVAELPHIARGVIRRLRLNGLRQTCGRCSRSARWSARPACPARCRAEPAFELSVPAITHHRLVLSADRRLTWICGMRG
jgi:hypothetical protein